ncbi:MAG: PPOX class F420-dependent oxidoreductase [Chloroflexi bacterium]|nr:PPOX class F420-dependent oxidoreductase [Chloroflexota bacterium]
MPNPNQIAFLNKYLSTSRIAVVTANGESGYPQVTPNWFNWDGQRLSISTTKDRFKYKNFTRDPRVTVLIYEEPMAVDYVQLRGEIEIQDDADIWGPTRAILGRYLRADKADDYIQKMKDTEERVVLWLKPDRIVHRNA